MQEHATASWEGGASFQDAVRADPRVAARLSTEQLDAAFSPAPHLRWLDTAYERMGLESTPEPTPAVAQEVTS